MTERRESSIVIEKISLERIGEIYDAVIESREDLFNAGMIPKTDLSMDELEIYVRNFIELWEKGTEYFFQIVEASTGQIVGMTFLNHVIRQYEMANLGYWIRTSRVGEGIATEAAKLVAKYGFEKLEFQRLEIVISRDNSPSLRVAEKLGAVREGLLRNRLQLLGSACDAYMHSLIPRDYAINKTA